MVAEYLWYGLAGLLVFAAVCWVNIRYEQGRRRAEENMTPDERREAKAFKGVFRRR